MNFRHSLSVSMACRLHLVWIFSCVHLICKSSQQETGFVYNGFDQADLFIDGLAKILPGGLLQLTNTTELQMGHAFFKQPFIFDQSSSLSFFTHFVCALVPPKLGADGGHGIAFVVSPSMNLSHALATQYMGVFSNPTNDTSTTSSHLLAIELDTVKTVEFNELEKPHVGIDVNNPISVESALPSYFSNALRKNISINLLSGEPIQVWVDYDGSSLNVSLAPLEIQKPNQPLISRSINLSEIFQEKMYVGFSASTGNLLSNHYILGWSFGRSKELLQTLDLSKLPEVPLPREEKKSPLLTGLVILLGILVLMVLGGIYLYRRNKYAEVRESWEKEYGPHRFSYISLYKATNGFSRDCRVGKGGFGEVYKGTLPLSRLIAVKRLTHDAEQGMKQFVAEVVTMGSLQHRNLVPLLGYCRRKGELLLVSEYMPNGSLDQYLFHNRNPSPSWLQRISILKDIASALSYLHIGATQVVLHRDIKASNVMLDSTFNGRLGDFGMAKFHDHGANLSATAAVGTIGYMAPELITMGTSTKTDVYAFGAFLLEVTCGRRPMEPELPVEKKYLVKWVCECWKHTSLLEARDPRMGGDFSSEEVELVLKLGLLCTNAVPESRPTMGQVLQYLNLDLALPDFSPYTPGIGAFMPVSMEALSAIEFPNSRNSSFSIFVTHTILDGHGR